MTCAESDAKMSQFGHTTLDTKHHQTLKTNPKRLGFRNRSLPSINNGDFMTFGQYTPRARNVATSRGKRPTKSFTLRSFSGLGRAWKGLHQECQSQKGPCFPKMQKTCMSNAMIIPTAISFKTNLPTRFVLSARCLQPKVMSVLKPAPKSNTL